MTEQEHQAFDKAFAVVLKEDRKQKLELVAAIILVPLTPFIMLFMIFVWNHLKVLF